MTSGYQSSSSTTSVGEGDGVTQTNGLSTARLQVVRPPRRPSEADGVGGGKLAIFRRV